jgi:hypothetical protein
MSCRWGGITDVDYGRCCSSAGTGFATGFALQRALEILDPVISKILPNSHNKKLILNFASFTVGVLLAIFAGLRVLAALGLYDASASNVAGLKVVDALVTGLIISGGTEGFNSIMKFLGYSKESAKQSSHAAGVAG